MGEWTVLHHGRMVGKRTIDDKDGLHGPPSF